MHHIYAKKFLCHHSKHLFSLYLGFLGSRDGRLAAAVVVATKLRAIVTFYALALRSAFYLILQNSNVRKEIDVMSCTVVGKRASNRLVSEAHLETFAIFFHASTLFTVATTGVLRGFDLERSDDLAGKVICRLGGSAGIGQTFGAKALGFRSSA